MIDDIYTQVNQIKDDLNASGTQDVFNFLAEARATCEDIANSLPDTIAFRNYKTRLFKSAKDLGKVQDWILEGKNETPN